MPGSVVASIITRLQQQDPSLQLVDLSDLELTAQELDALLEALRTNHFVKSITFADLENFTEHHAIMLNSVLQSNLILEELIIYPPADMPSPIAHIILAALLRNRSLKRVYLGWQLNSPADYNAVAEVLNRNNTLELFKVDALNVGDSIIGFHALQSALYLNTTLKAFLVATANEPFSLRQAIELVQSAVHIEVLAIAISDTAVANDPTTINDLIMAYMMNPSIHILHLVFAEDFDELEKIFLQRRVDEINQYRTAMYRYHMSLAQPASNAPSMSFASSAPAYDSSTSASTSPSISVSSSLRNSPVNVPVPKKFAAEFVELYWQQYINTCTDDDEFIETQEYLAQVHTIFEQLVSQAFKRDFNYLGDNPELNHQILHRINALEERDAFVINPHVKLNCKQFPIKIREQFIKSVGATFGDLFKAAPQYLASGLMRPIIKKRQG